MKEYGPDTMGTVVPEAAATAAVEVLDELLLVEVLEEVDDVESVEDEEDVEGLEDVEDEEDVKPEPAGAAAIFAVSS